MADLKDKKDKKDKYISIRVSQKEKELLSSSAKHEDLSLSEYILSHTLYKEDLFKFLDKKFLEFLLKYDDSTFNKKDIRKFLDFIAGTGYRDF